MKPIIFDAESVRGILDGSKTMARRVVKDSDRYADWQHAEPIYPGRLYEFPGADERYYLLQETHGQLRDYDYQPIRCPYGKPGDRLWVKEAWMPYYPASGSWDNPADPGIFEPGKGQIPKEWLEGLDVAYKETFITAGRDPGDGWFSPLFMPRWASRIELEIVSIRVERLQDIGEDDAIAEGAQPWVVDDGAGGFESSYVEGFARRWNAINAKRGFPWESNPWVFAISFRRLIA